MADGTSIRARPFGISARRSVFGLVRATQALSLDVTLGVLCAAALATFATGAAMPVSWWVALPAATWCIYSADRWLDARRLGAGAHTARHRWYAHRLATVGLQTLIIAGLTLLVAMVFLPLQLRVPGILLAAGAGLHLLLAQTGGLAILPKELTAAGLYTFGIWFGPFMVSGATNRWTVFLVSLHFVAAFLNLISFALFEEARDRLDGQVSLVCSWGRERVLQWLVRLTVLAGVGTVGLVALAPSPLVPAAAALLPVVLLPALMLRFGGFFGANGRYRLFGDLCFLLLALPTLARVLVATHGF